MYFKDVAFYFIGVCCGFLFFCNYLLQLQYQSEHHARKLVSTHLKEFENRDSMKSTCLADGLFKSVKVLCLVMTYPPNHNKSRHVLATWGKRCNKLLFVTRTVEPDLPTMLLDIPDGRDHLWNKTRDAYEYVYKHHLDDADWFMKTDDDSYVVMENVRHLLYSYDSNTSLLVGHKNYEKDGKSFVSGAGYILSKRAVIDLVEKSLPNDESCRSPAAAAEDVGMGRCLRNYSLLVGTLDEMKQQRFFPFGIHPHIEIDREWNHWFFRPWYITPWYFEHMYYDLAQGSLECCSEWFGLVSYAKPLEMHLLDYLIYKVLPFGIKRNFNETLPRKFDLEEIGKAANEKSFQEALRH